MGSADIDRWIREQHGAGHSRNQLLHQLITYGWSAPVAEKALAAVLGEPGPAVPQQREVEIEGHRVEVLVNLQQPRFAYLRGLLTREECEALIEAARPRLVPSAVVDSETGGNVPHAARVSDGMAFEVGELPLLDRIEWRIQGLVSWPMGHGEAIQVLRYRPGGRYDPHFDYFDPKVPGSSRPLAQAGNRVGTLIMVLQAPETGGETVFPDAGLTVHGRQGDGILFTYGRPDPSTKSLHGGSPVVRGEKWIATKWFRESEYSVARPPP
jgi:prolyl 4-hydroxylase